MFTFENLLLYLFLKNNINYFIDLFKSIPDKRKIVLLIFLFQKDEVLIREIGFSERDINVSNLEFNNVLNEQHEAYLD